MKLISQLSKISLLRSDGVKYMPMILKGCTSEAGAPSAHSHKKEQLFPLGADCIATVLTGGNFIAENSGVQAPEPQMGLKQFMISGLPRHVLAYTWFL